MSAIVFAFAVMAAIAGTDLYIELGVAIGALYTGPTLIAMLFTDRPLRVAVPMACCLLILAGWWHSPSTGEDWKVAANRVISIVCVVNVAIAGLRMKIVHSEDAYRAVIGRIAKDFLDEIRREINQQ
jgi:hypothetical protein